jgi:hypothetical protein
MRRPGSSSSLASSRGGLILLILAVPALTLSLAYATPPGSSWIPGIYDDADVDDVIRLATSEEKSVVGAEGALTLRLALPTTSSEVIIRFPTAALLVRAPPAL